MAKENKDLNKDSPKTVPLTVRVSPGMKFGLELLSRVQHRPLSQAAEWAIKLALRNTRVGTAKSRTLFDLYEQMEKEPTEAQKLWRLAAWDRPLLSWEERAVVAFIESSPGAMTPARDDMVEVTDPETGMSDVATIEIAAAPVWEKILPQWEKIRAYAIHRANEGFPGKTPPLDSIIDFDGHWSEIPLGIEIDTTKRVMPPE